MLLKRDRRGRVRTPVAQREALLDAFERSGLSGMKFAALHGVKYPSFAHWVQQRKRQRSVADSGAGSESGEGHGHGNTPAGSSPQWWEAVVDRAAVPAGRAEASGSGLRLHLPGGVWMEITAPEQAGWAAQLLAALAPGGAPRASKLQFPQPC